MRPGSGLVPTRMDRVAVVAPTASLGPVLECLGATGTVQLELVGEAAAVEEVEAAACRQGEVSAVVGWAPSSSVPALAESLAPLGGAVARLRPPGWSDPPTLVEGGGATGAFQPLVDTYTTLPYADVNPAAFAGVAYVVMFGMMFGDVGHGALVAAGGLLLASGRPRRLARFRHLAPFVVAAGLASIGFGAAFGDFFGPTHLFPVLWLAPLEQPTTLLAVAVAAGAGLLAAAYALGAVNRWREGGAARAVLALSGLAGASLYLGVAGLGLGWYFGAAPAMVAGAVLALAGLVTGFLGCEAESGGVAQAAVQLFDATVRIGTNTVSFARLAAFGLTHAALCGVVWSGTTGLWHRGAAMWPAAVAVFVGGNAVAFALEGLVAGIQALRLEYYELFSRIFALEGRPFCPWRPPGDPPAPPEEAPCSPG